MTPIATVAAAARVDLDTHTLWLRGEAGAETAERFARAAIATFQRLAQTPHLGPQVVSALPGTDGLRKWRIEGFSKVLIFYRPSGMGIEVVRVLHAAQDWWSNLDLWR